MNTVLNGLEGVICLINDVLIHGKDKNEHDERLRKVLERLQESGVILNNDKCEFWKTELKFLGHMVS